MGNAGILAEVSQTLGRPVLNLPREMDNCVSSWPITFSFTHYPFPPPNPPQSLRLLSLSTNETLANPSPKRQATVTGPDSVLSRASLAVLVTWLLVLCVLPEFQDVRIHHQ